jgi:hypothetical protein
MCGVVDLEILTVSILAAFVLVLSLNAVDVLKGCPSPRWLWDGRGSSWRDVCGKLNSFHRRGLHFAGSSVVWEGSGALPKPATQVCGNWLMFAGGPGGVGKRREGFVASVAPDIGVGFCLSVG